jgi:FkbM family methyltransferase
MANDGSRALTFNLQDSMRKIIFGWIKRRLVHPIATRCGYVPYNSGTKNAKPSQNDKNELLNNFYTILKKVNFTPKHIVDVGANHGTWTREALKYFPDAYFTMVEPQYWLKESFNDLLESNSKIRFYPVGAGKQSGTFKFTIVDRDDSCTFKFTQEEAMLQGYKQLDLPITTINEVLSKQDIFFPDIVKIDAEGLDLEVLEGASECFGKTEIFMVEAAIVSKQMPNTFLTLTSYMDKNGYTLFDITDLNRPFKLRVLWLTELVFVKKGGVLDSLTENDIIN